MNIDESYDVITNPYQEEPDLHILFAGQSQTRPGHHVGPKVFDYYLIHHILSGYGTFTTGNHNYELKRGDSFIIEPGHLVGYRADSLNPWQYEWIAVKGKKFTDMLMQAGVTLSSPVIHSTDNTANKWFEQIRKAFIGRDSGGGLEACGYLYLLLADFQQVLHPERLQQSEALTRIERHVKQVAQLLTTQYTEPISIENIAQSFGYNRAYFS